MGKRFPSGNHYLNNKIILKQHQLGVESWYNKHITKGPKFLRCANGCFTLIELIQDGMGLDGMGWDGLGLGWDGMGRVGIGLGWDGLGLGCDGLG